MKSSHSSSENSIAFQYPITGPHMEPPTIPNATTYWRCSSCARESTRERDLYRTTFHALSCEVHEC